MLRVKNLGVRYRTQEILSDISFTLPANSFVALLGPNGTGKSSLLKALAGLIQASGTVGMNDEEAVPISSRGQAIAYMPQDTGASSSLTVLEVILLGQLHSLGLQVSNELVQKATDLLSLFGLEELSTRTLDAISGGQRQLVYLAQSLFRNPQVLLLDEPTAALDFRHQLIVLDRVRHYCRENGTIAIAAMHDLSLAANCADQVICLSNGQIAAQGNPRDILKAPLLRLVYGVEVDIADSPSGILHIAPVQPLNPTKSRLTL